MYARLNPLVKNLPTSGQLKTGERVSNYHLLPDTILKSEGWLPLDEIRPECGESQALMQDSIAEVDGRIVVTYKAVDSSPDEIDLMLNELEGLL